MTLEIDGEAHKVISSYYPADDKVDFEFPILLNGTKIAFRSRGWPNVWNVGYIKVHPTLMTVHWVSLINHTFIDESPDFYLHLWVINKIGQFGTLLESHILESPEVKL